MYDLPSGKALLEAARLHLKEQVIPAIKGNRRLYFQTLVAMNVIQIVEREIASQSEDLRQEWAALNALLNLDTPLPEATDEAEAAIRSRYQTICELIQRGDYDKPEARAALVTYLMEHTLRQLRVSNPRFLQGLLEEAAR